MALNETNQKLVEEALRQMWGFASFRPHQLTAITAVMEGRDSLTVLPTGGGKSLCYQLPASLMTGTAIVVSPLISLMADQVQALQLLGVPSAYLNSSLRAEEVRWTKTRLFRGELKLLYVSPERLMLDHFLEEIGQVRISFFAIDEAHCISQWGHDFRPEYSQLRVLRERFPDRGIHGFTATAPPRVQREICEAMDLREPEVLIGSYHRPNLIYRCIRRNRLSQQVLGLVKKFEPGDSGIVYCLTRRATEQLAETLSDNGYRALPYHAGLNKETRQRNQERFSREEVPIMVATVAFGMGIDQSNVRFVIHTGMPRTLSHYQQESGRAGRDGLPSQCVLIYSAQDIHFWKRMNAEEPALEEARAAQLREMIRYATQLQCRHKTLVEHFGQRFETRACQSCDVCLGEVDSIPEARKISRMILSAVLKTRERFGAAYVAQVLTGSREKKILANGHENLSVYNLLNDQNQSQVHDWINQLESQGYLARDTGQFPTLRVTQPGYWLLRPEKFDKKTADLPVFLVQSRAKVARPARPAAGSEVAPYDMELFERLRAVRRELAAQLQVPAFVVFGDRSLQDMARKKPTDEAGFLAVFGVGQAKLERFGQPMLAIIRQYVGADDGRELQPGS